MEKNQYGIILDGKMDEPIWDTVPEYSGFHFLQSNGGGMQPEPTYFKILSCEDRIYIGFRCMEPEQMASVIENKTRWNSWGANDIEIFLAPAGNTYDFYQFCVGFAGQKVALYYAEDGNIQPDPYAPVWDFAVYTGEDYWGAEVEIPLTAFYMTSNSRWSDKWLVNLARTRSPMKGAIYSSWSPLKFAFKEPYSFRSLEGFPMRAATDDVCISNAVVEIQSDSDGYKGFVTVRATVSEAGEYCFTSDHAESVTVQLQVGDNSFTAPCSFEALGRTQISLSLTRTRDGKAFKRFYPVRVSYEPLIVKLTLPEYRNNFYPGQDYSKIEGTVKANSPVTMTLEGPGIPKQTIIANADGSFRFNTPNFEIGEAWLTASIDGIEVKKKIRRLAPIDRTMTWISKGNLVLNGKPVVARKFYGPHYGGGVALNRKYDQDNLHVHRELSRGGLIHASDLVKGSEGAGGEATQDRMPSDEMLRKIDAVLEKDKDRNFGFYYISDEPECRGVSPVYLKNLYEYIADRDPYHVVMMAIRGASRYIDSADWFQTHPYICPYNEADGTRLHTRPLHTLGGYIDEVVKLNRPDKCIGFLPTCYASGGAVNGWDYPTLDEYIAHTWAAMIHGGKTLWPYAYHDVGDRPSLYEGNRYVFSSFEALEELVLHGERTTLAKSTDYESVLYDNGDEKMFVLVNYSMKPQTVTLDNLTGTWHEFRGSRTFTGKTFELKPLETVIGTNVVKGADLPTYAETAALIDKLEYDRTHNHGLLVGRGEEITVSGSSMRGWKKVRLFDGMVDNLAYDLHKSEEQYLEVDVSKFHPTFTKVVLHGYNIEDAELKFKNGETCVAAEVESVSTDEFSKTFLLKAPVTPDALRFDFFAQLPIELYELEVF